MKVWVERHPKMRNSHGCHYYLKMLFEKIFLKMPSELSSPTSPQRIKANVTAILKFKLIRFRCLLVVLMNRMKLSMTIFKIRPKLVLG